MNINNLKILYFSPTGTTKKIIDTIAGLIQSENQESINFTSKRVRENSFPDADSSLAIIGCPVYYGRIPAEVMDYFSKFHVNNIPAILVVVYGNREYEDSLKELYDSACAAGFVPIAGAAFIGEHSYSSEKLPMAPGRPDETDLEKARQFGITISERFELLVKNSNFISIPGNCDYRNKPIPKYPVAPGTQKEQCNLCDICIEICPVEAISIDEDSNLKTDIDSCILCFACVKKCPLKARGINDPLWARGMEMLQKQCFDRKEPEFFLSSTPEM